MEHLTYSYDIQAIDDDQNSAHPVSQKKKVANQSTKLKHIAKQHEECLMSLANSNVKLVTKLRRKRAKCAALRLKF
jgi:hypothetical protein